MDLWWRAKSADVMGIVMGNALGMVHMVTIHGANTVGRARGSLNS